MPTHSGRLGDFVPCAVALLLAFVAPASARAQTPSRDTTTTAPAPVKDLPLTAAQRQAFVGTYAVTLPYGEQRTLRVFEEDGVLKGQPNDNEPRRLLYQGDNVFRPEGADFVLTFVVENGRATKFTSRREDGVMQGTRVP